MRDWCLFPLMRRGFGSGLHLLLLILTLTLTLVLAGLAGCSSSGGKQDATESIDVDSAPGNPPKGLASVPDAKPKREPKARYGNPKSYVVFGKRYYTKPSSKGYVETGGASWYGKKFHGRKTSSGERYNMYGMTAAHKTLPLPTYAKVTNLANRRSVIVKINDRGPFHGKRIIDLSYAAATKLGVLKHGVAKVEVRAIDPARPEALKSVRPTVVSTKKRKTRPTETELTAKQADGVVMGPVVVKKKPKPVAVASARKAPAPAPKVAKKTAKPKPGSGANLYLQVGAFGSRVNAEQLKTRLVSHLEEQVDVKGSAGASKPLYKVRIGPIASDTEAVQVSQKLAALGVSESHRVFD